MKNYWLQQKYNKIIFHKHQLMKYYFGFDHATISQLSNLEIEILTKGIKNE